MHTGDIVPYDASTDASDILLIMGGSSNHVVTILSCILSFVNAFPNSPLLYIDFGITAQERCWLEYVFRMVHAFHEKRNASVPIYFRTVDWDHFPDWFHITKGLNHGGYAWKPLVIADAFYQWKGVVMWNDGGNYFKENCIGGSSPCERRESICHLIMPDWIGSSTTTPTTSSFNTTSQNPSIEPSLQAVEATCSSTITTPSAEAES